MRRLPHQGARHGTVDHGHAFNGVFFLLHLRVLPLSWAILLRRSPSSLSLACGWPLGANGSLSCEWRHPHELRVEYPLGARKGGPNRPWKWARPASLGRPAQAHPDPARSLLHSRGSSCVYALCPLHLYYIDDVILVSKMEVLFAWSSVFYASILGDVPS
jgi:hypothetical protein